MEATVLNQGLTLMLVGMGTVFVFLTLLVIAMTLMAAIISPTHSRSTMRGWRGI